MNPDVLIGTLLIITAVLTLLIGLISTYRKGD